MKNKKTLYVAITDETKASEKAGFDVDVWDESGDGRDEEISVCGFKTLVDAEIYVSKLKSEYNVVHVQLND